MLAVPALMSTATGLVLLPELLQLEARSIELV